MKNSEYWKLRAEQAEKEMHEKSEKKGTSAVLKAQFLNLVKSSLEQLT